MEENNINVVEFNDVPVEKVLSGLTTKELRKELAKRGGAKVKSTASRAKKWVLGALAIGGAAAGGVAVGYHMKRDYEDPVVMYPDDDGGTTGTTVGDILNDNPTENEN